MKRLHISSDIIKKRRNIEKTVVSCGIDHCYLIGRVTPRCTKSSLKTEVGSEEV